MTEDERRNKLYEENRFYLELQHKHGGNFEAMLTPDELTIWNIFPDFHKSFFTYFKGQEWEIVSSLRLFSDETIVGKINGQSVKKSEQAKLSLEGYLQYRQQNKTTLLLHELQELLYPLRAFSSNLLQQEIAENLFYDASNPDIASWRDSQEWQQYGVVLQSIPLTWLESKKSEYLRQCASVWRCYLPKQHRTDYNDLEIALEKALDFLELTETTDQLSHKPITTGMKIETLQTLEWWCEEIKRLYGTSRKFKFHKSICVYIADSKQNIARHSAEYIRRQTQDCFRQIKAARKIEHKSS